MMWDVIVGSLLKRRRISLLYLGLTLSLFLTLNSLYGQDNPYKLRIVEYNVENLFDTVDNPSTEDDEFTIEHFRRWSGGRYYHKLDQIAKVLVSIFPHCYPDIICLCEIENRGVLSDLVKHPLLYPAHYHIVHHDGPDPRGIDVAVLYRGDHLMVDSLRFVPNRDKEKSFREVVNIAFTWHSLSFYLWGCHLPSNYSGVRKSQKERGVCIANISHAMSAVADSLPHLWMGDFNTETQSKNLQALSVHMNETAPFVQLIEKNDDTPGTLRFREFWFLYDMIFLWKKLPQGVSIVDKGIYFPSFLLQKEEKYGGVKPYRTFVGYKYQRDGFSDHLPVYVVLEQKY